jgi:hypothetical protein
MADQFHPVDVPASLTTRPRARAHEIVERIVDKSLMVYDLKEQRVHILNQTAAMIWTLCDGERALDEIAEIVAADFPDHQDVTRIDVTELVQAFADEQLLVTR